ncbi:SUKH-4 family immunity protein [Streptomyces sp. NPDC003374]
MSTTCTTTAVITRREGDGEGGDRPVRFAPYPGRPGRSGLALDLPGRMLEEEFGRGRVARFEDVDFPAALTHGPTRRFLRDTGLPDDGRLFQLDTDMPLPTVAEYYADERPGTRPPAALPAHAHHWIRLGRLASGSTPLLDGATGRIWNWNEQEATLHPLDEDISTLAHTLVLLHRTMPVMPVMPVIRQRPPART